MPLWLLFTLLSILGWSFGEFFAKKGFDDVSPVWTNIIACWLGFLVYLPIIFIFGRGSLVPISGVNIVFIIVACICYLSYFYALSKGKLALTTTVLSTYPLVTIVCAQLFLHEHVNLAQTIGIGLILVSVVALGIQEALLQKERFVWGNWLLWGFLAAFLNGIADFLNKVVINQVGAFSQSLAFILIIQFVCLGNYLWDKKGRKLPKLELKRLLPTLLGGLLVAAGTMAMLFAFQYGPATVVAPATSAYVVVTILLSFIFLKEKVSASQFLLMVTTLLGVFLLSR